MYDDEEGGGWFEGTIGRKRWTDGRKVKLARSRRAINRGMAGWRAGKPLVRLGRRRRRRQSRGRGRKPRERTAIALGIRQSERDRETEIGTDRDREHKWIARVQGVTVAQQSQRKSGEREEHKEKREAKTGGA